MSFVFEMGLLKLLTFPVSGPIAGARWTLQTLLSEAERRYYDPAAIHRQLSELELQLRTGQIGQEKYDQDEEILLKRLLEARAFQRQKANDQTEAP